MDVDDDFEATGGVKDDIDALEGFLHVTTARVQELAKLHAKQVKRWSDAVSSIEAKLVDDQSTPETVIYEITRLKASLASAENMYSGVVNEVLSPILELEGTQKDFEDISQGSIVQCEGEIYDNQIVHSSSKRSIAHKSEGNPFPPRPFGRENLSLSSSLNSQIQQQDRGTWSVSDALANHDVVSLLLDYVDRCLI